MTTSPEAVAAVDALGEAFLSGDPDLVLAHFAGTGDVIYAGSEAGEVAVGEDAIRTLLDALFARDERYSWRTTTVSTAGTGDALYVVADAHLSVHPILPGGSTGSATEQVPYRLSGVLERDGAAWRWRLCHGSEPAQA